MEGGMKQSQEMALEEDLSFEEALAELEEIVLKLEGNADSLADSVALFQRGRHLASFCQNLLDKAELQISKLNQTNDGTQTLEPFSADTLKT
jgi:exodeoxyribonuclease VII small subunit